MVESFSHRKRAAQAIFVCVFIVEVCWLALARNNPVVGTIWAASLAFLLLSIAAFITWRIVAQTLFDPYMLFLLSGILFNGGQLILEVFGLNDAGLLGGVVPEDVLYDTIFLVILAIGSLHLGAILGIGQAGREDLEKQNGPEEKRSLRIVGGTLLLLALPGKILTSITKLQVVMALGHFGQYQEQGVFTLGWSSLPRITSLFFYPGIFLLFVSTTNSRMLRRVLFVIPLVDGLLGMFMGNRGEAISILAATFWIWHTSVRRIPKWMLVSGLPIMALMVVVVGQVRSLSGSERSSASFVANAFTSVNNPNVALLSEFGGSMATVAYSLVLVPSEREFDHGAGYLQAFRSLIPSLYWNTHESYATWITRTVAPDVAASGGGIGFSYIAEAYVNFGWYGVPIVFLLMGILFIKLVKRGMGPSTSSDRALIALVLLFILSYPRGEMVAFLNRVVLCAFAPFALVQLLSRSKKWRDPVLRQQDG